MDSVRKKILYYSIPFILVFTGIYFVVPKPELIVSVLIRLFAFGVALHVSLRYREWRILFLAAMFFLMALRQVFTFFIWTGVVERSPLTNAMSELPGMLVTFLALLSIIYIGLILSGNAKTIKAQQESINTLNSLLPMCSKCRRIKDDDGYWRELELYIESHTDSQFSHGLCQECSDEMYGDQEWYKKSMMKRKAAS